MLSSLVDGIERDDYTARLIREVIFLMALHMVEKSMKDF